MDDLCCSFCGKVFKDADSVTKIVKHMKREHDLDLISAFRIERHG